MDKSRRKVSKLMMLMSGFPLVAGFGHGGPPSQNMKLESIAGKLLNADSQLRDLGRCYFEHGCEAGGLIEQLYLNLRKDNFISESYQCSTRAFCDLVYQDFEKGEVLNIDGWVLSKSEVALGLVAYMLEHTGSVRK